MRRPTVKESENSFMNGLPRYLLEEHEKIYRAELIRRSRAMECPLLVLGDSYKAGHFKMYQDAIKMSAYGEFRQGMDLNGITDKRIIVYGMRYIIDQLVSRVITEDHVDCAEMFYGTHGLGGTKYEYPKEMFDEIRKLGYFPVKIEALPEGSVVLPHTPVFIVTAEEKFSRFCTFLETILTMIWYPSCVATLSKHTKCLIEGSFERTAQGGKAHFLLNSRLHDFGFRGCTCVEQSVLGGSAHLLNFDGSDTMTACYHVQYHLNGGRHIGESIPATEHSVMTSFTKEIDSMKNLIEQYPGQVIACVMDSYNYEYALDVLLPQIKDLIEEKKCTFVIRPDSGDPVVQVLKALRAAVKANFSQEIVSIEGQSYIVLKNVAVIQGDGINYGTVKDILEAVESAGFSAVNVAFGMGGGLLQKVNRDTLSFATKLSYVKFPGGEERKVMKAPFGVESKQSLPGLMKVLRSDNANERYHKVFTEDAGTKAEKKGYSNSMVLVYDNGKINDKYMSETFDEIRKRVCDEWDSCGVAIAKGITDPLDTSMVAEKKEVADIINENNGTYTTPAGYYHAADKNQGVLEKISGKILERLAIVEKEKIERERVERGFENSMQLFKTNFSQNLIPKPAAAALTSEYSNSDMEYPLMRLNALLDNLSSKLGK